MPDNVIEGVKEMTGYAELRSAPAMQNAHILFKFYINAEDVDRLNKLAAIQREFNKEDMDASEISVEPPKEGGSVAEAAAAATPTPRTRNKRAPEPAGETEQWVVYNDDGEVRATYSTPKDAADVIIVAGSTCETEDQLANLIDKNMKMFAKLPKEDQDRVKESLAGMVTKLQAKAAPTPTAEPEPDLDALMGGGNADSGTITAEDFNKGMVAFTQKAGPTATKVFGEPIIKKYGSIKQVPASDYALVLAAADEFLAKLAK